MIELGRLEINIVDHCNLRCRACNHLSPALPKDFIGVEELKYYLQCLRPFLQAKVARLMGGEPLLHPKIDKVLEVIATSDIGKEVQVVTNGVLLERMTPFFWRLIDSVDLSIYPGITPKWPEEFSHKVHAHPCETFFETFSTIENKNQALVRRIWDTCKVKNVCYGLVDGHFFKCMRSAFIPRGVGLEPLVDGIHVDGITEQMLFWYIKSDGILDSCRYCTGSLGKRFPHEEIKREADWMAPQARPVSEMLEDPPGAR